MNSMNTERDGSYLILRDREAKTCNAYKIKMIGGKWKPIQPVIRNEASR